MSQQPGQVDQAASRAASGHVALTLLAGLGASFLGAAVWCFVTYIFIRSGFMLIGLGSFAAAWCVALIVRKAAGRVTQREQVIAAVFSTLAAVGGIFGLMMLSTGKSPAVLFSEGEREATFNTLFNLMQYLSWAIAAFCGWFFVRRNS